MKTLFTLAIVTSFFAAAESEACRCFRFVPFAENVQSTFANGENKAALVLVTAKEYPEFSGVESPAQEDLIRASEVRFDVKGVLRGGLSNAIQELTVGGFGRTSCSAFATGFKLGQSYLILVEKDEQDQSYRYSGDACSAGSVVVDGQ
jgi:hypothetical protein